MFEDIEEDDLFSFPTTSSNFASLFGQTIEQPAARSNLTFTAPKQPSAKPDESLKQKSKPSSSVMLFKEVHAFKLTLDMNVLHGICGLALIGNDSANIFHLLIYKHQKDIISTTRVNRNFEFTIENDNYASYNDDDKCRWRIHFLNETDVSEFSDALKNRNVKIIIAATKKDVTSEKIPVPDQIPLMKPYILKKPSPNEISVESDVQSDSSGTAARANILSRMAKMGQKLLPNAQSKPSTDSDSDDIAQPNLKSRKPKKSPNMPSIASEFPKNSEMQQNTPNTSSQHLIINGQYYPIPQPQLTQPVLIPVSTPVPLTNAHHTMLPLEASSPIMYTPRHFMNDQLNVFFAENRTHNSEVRMNVMRLTTKMEEMLEKINRLDLKPEHGNAAQIEDNEQLKVTTEEQKRLLEEFKQKYENGAKTIEELGTKEKESETKITELTKTIEEHELKHSQQLELIQKLQMELDERNKVIEEMETSKQEIKLSNNKRITNADEKMKKSMNELYHSVASDVTDENFYTGKEIKSILASRIRQYTYYIISIFDGLNTPNATPNEVSGEIKE